MQQIQKNTKIHKMKLLFYHPGSLLLRSCNDREARTIKSTLRALFNKKLLKPLA